MSKEFKRYTVTSALPYANGPVHVGHLAGVYVPADIYVRYLRMKGRDVIFIGGSDEHGVPITIKAREAGITPKQIVDRYHTMIRDAFSEFGISFDIYSRTSNAMHHQTSSAFFEKLYREGKFIEKTSDQFYDTEAGQFLADRYITGTCPRCGNERAYGDQCEACGSSLSPEELIQPRSTLSGSAPVLKTTRHWYLPLQEYEPWLREWILEGHKNDWRANVYGQCKSWIDQGLQPRAVTRDLDWGVKVPVEGAEGKVLYVWFDAPIGYISATRELTDNWETYWKDPESRLIHFIGKDNIVFHCIIFPAMLKAEGSYILPDNVPSNEFLNLEGEKISTSRNWAVWLHEYLQEFPGKQDVLRYVLTANAPETKDNDFTWKDFQARNNNELLAILGNLVNRTVVLTHKFFGGVVPEVTELTEDDRLLLGQLEDFPGKIAENIEHFRFREGLNQMMNLARLGNKYLTDQEPWKKIKTDEERVKTILNLSLQVCASLTLVSAPFLPFTSQSMHRLLNISENRWDDAGNQSLLKPGTVLGDPVFLFEKIEDDAIQFQIDKLEKTRQQNLQPKAAIPLEPAREPVNYDDFLKMDIRTATILAAEAVPKTQKLLKLTVDTGLDTRTIVSGIAEYFKPEEIIGKKVAVLVNLEPRQLRGITSNGMILMAQNPDGTLFFVTPEGADVVSGATIR
ncbi:MAG TPA: methionine--tRNA ligase [Bacteroidales bacterium]|nr:methionine--tRNA ligase [Bacteroidales bacterium]HRZ48596.1 methionine--tRNA ligase [Bacteroidales bacterium]